MDMEHPRFTDLCFHRNLHLYRGFPLPGLITKGYFKMFYLTGLPHLAKQPAAGLQLIFFVGIQLPSGSVQPGHETPPIKFMSFATGWWFQNVFDTVMTNDKFSCFSGLLKPSDHPDISPDISRHIQTIRSRRGSSRIFHPLILSSLVETGAWPTTDNEMRRNP
jgi:hypothetical protein